MNKHIIGALAAAVVAAAPLVASATVQVTIANNESNAISVSTSNICGATTPTPGTIGANTSLLYSNANCSSIANSGHITYQNTYPVTSGTCRFDYSSIYTLGSGGTYSWVFNSNATPSGNAGCTSKITSLNPATGDFSVTFTMKHF